MVDGDPLCLGDCMLLKLPLNVSLVEEVLVSGILLSSRNLLFVQVLASGVSFLFMFIVGLEKTVAPVMGFGFEQTDR